jgi:cytochrome c2
MPENQLHRSRQDIERAELLARLSPGVVQTGTSTSAPIHHRLLAWSKQRLQSANGPLRTGGYLKVPATGEYRFSVEPKQAVTGLQLLINGQSISFDGHEAAVRLRKGLAKIDVLPSVAAEDSSFRLMWQSNQFPRESIPSTSLFHEAVPDDMTVRRERIQEGQNLFAKHQCGRCHAIPDTAAAAVSSGTDLEQLRLAPMLQGIGSRRNPGWLAAWLREPRHLRGDAAMPKIPGVDAADVNRDLVAYLCSLRDESEASSNATAPPKHQDEKILEKGANLFERLGCIACHTFAEKDPTPEWNRISLHFANAKFHPGQLREFLKTPHRYHDGSHMPDFHLTEDEAGALTAHIEASSKGQISSPVSSTGADITRGQKLFSEMKCDRCHQVSANQRLAKADVRSPFASQPKSGCLAIDAPPHRSAPRFAFTERERGSLQQFLAAAHRNDSVLVDSETNVIPQAIASLRCTACHAHDATSALWPEIVADEGSGNLTETVPPLTWVGEKLQGPWIAKLLTGDLKQKPRPWLAARMPSFPKYAKIISHGLADQHGVAYEESLPKEFDPDRVELGRHLTLRDGGLDCRQCHGIGKELPHGDVKTQIALGINFAIVRDRLRPEFVMRQLFDPPRYDIGSRMPRFAPDLKTTTAKHLADGDAAVQFDALKQYLLSLEVKD